MSEEPKTGQQYSNYVGAPGFFLLNQACAVINAAFDDHVCCYLVGSATKKRDWRDVDVRCIVEDDVWDRLFPEVAGESAGLAERCALWSLMCSSIALYLKQQTGLPIDFQLQRASLANKLFSRKDGHERVALGLFLGHPKKRTDGSGATGPMT